MISRELTLSTALDFDDPLGRSVIPLARLRAGVVYDCWHALQLESYRRHVCLARVAAPLFPTPRASDLQPATGSSLAHVASCFSSSGWQVRRDPIAVQSELDPSLRGGVEITQHSIGFPLSSEQQAGSRAYQFHQVDRRPLSLCITHNSHLAAPTL